MSSRDDVIEEANRIFTEVYPRAKSLHLRHEALTGERSVQTLANFRDGLHHMGNAIKHLQDDENDHAQEELSHVEDHLERIIYDGSKRPVEARLSYIQNNRQPSILYKVTLLPAPTNEEFNRRMMRIRELYFEGRDDRKEQALEEANDLASELKEDTPPKREVFFRLIILAAAIVTLSSGASFLLL